MVEQQCLLLRVALLALSTTPDIRTLHKHPSEPKGNCQRVIHQAPDMAAAVQSRAMTKAQCEFMVYSFPVRHATPDSDSTCCHHVYYNTYTHQFQHVCLAGYRLQAKTWQAMTDSNPVEEGQLGSQHDAAQQGSETQPQQHHLQAALTRSAIVPKQAFMGPTLLQKCVVHWNTYWFPRCNVCHKLYEMTTCLLHIQSGLSIGSTSRRIGL